MQMTPGQFSEVLRSSAGGDEVADPGADFLDTPFEDLGYDSLALLETVGEIERVHGVALSEEVVGEVSTPRELLDLVNEHLAARPVRAPMRPPSPPTGCSAPTAPTTAPRATPGGWRGGSGCAPSAVGTAG